MTTIDSLDRFLEVQLQAWSRHDAEQKRPRVEPVIAITREPGCDGESIAQTLADAFNLVLYDWEILEQIAKDARVSEQVVATLDNNLSSELADWLAGFTGGAGLSSYQYTQSLRRVLFTVATHGNAVILGRGANFLLPPDKRTLGLCLVAPMDARVATTMQALGLSRENALRHIEKAERAQRLWVRKFAHADINDTTHYHLVVNTAMIAAKTIVQLAKVVLGIKS